MILIVEDEKAISDILAFNLKKEGYKVHCEYDGIAGYNYAVEKNPDLILLDIMIPKMDGFTFCKRFRKTSQTPIIMLTARSEEADKVLGLDIGADDYVTKPFGMRELLARVKANLRKTKIDEEENGDFMNIEDLTLDFKKFIIIKGDKTVILTTREFELITFLAKERGKIFSREQLLKKVWGYEYFGDARTVDVTIRRIRTKLEDEPNAPKYVLTKRGVGYFFVDKNKNEGQ